MIEHGRYFISWIQPEEGQYWFNGKLFVCRPEPKLFLDVKSAVRAFRELPEDVQKAMEDGAFISGPRGGEYDIWGRRKRDRNKIRNRIYR